jgi:hypothetical protein
MKPRMAARVRPAELTNKWFRFVVNPQPLNPEPVNGYHIFKASLMHARPRFICKDGPLLI